MAVTLFNRPVFICDGEEYDMLDADIPIELISAGRYQGRGIFDTHELEKLSRQIKATNGVMSPILLRKHSDTEYEIIFGERRWRATGLAQLPTIRCRIITGLPEGNKTVEAALFLMAHYENEGRVALTPLEKAEYYLKLKELFSFTQNQLVAYLEEGKTEESETVNRNTIANILRLNNLEPRVKEFLRQKKINKGGAIVLLALKGDAQIELATIAAKRKLSVKQLRKRVDEILKVSVRKQGNVASDADKQRLERFLTDELACEVSFENYGVKKPGTMKIKYNTLEELQGILEKITTKTKLQTL